MKKKVILVGGYCATGKSTFAGMLSRELGIPYFDKDTIKEVMGEAIGQENASAMRKLSVTAFGLMSFMAERMMLCGCSFIMESNFKPSDAEQFKLLTGKYGYDSLTYVFKGDLDVLFDRYSAREQRGERHWVHMTDGAMDESARASFKTGHIPLGEIKPGGQVLYTDATDFEKVDYDCLLKAVVDFMK